MRMSVNDLSSKSLITLTLPTHTIVSPTQLHCSLHTEVPLCVLSQQRHA
jgi:hypothetical protein